MDFQSLIVKLLVTEDNSLENLAKIAGQDAKTFYRTANFRSADLSSENLSNFDLSQSSVSKKDWPFWKKEFSLVRMPLDTVRMRSSVLVQIHETFSQHFYREHSLRLEQLIWLVLHNYREDFLAALRKSSLELNARRQSDLELSARRTLEGTGIDETKGRKSYAYTFSDTLRDEIRQISRENGVSSGRCISELIYYCFVHYDNKFGRPVNGVSLAEALRSVAQQNKLNDGHFGLNSDEALFKNPPTSQKTNPDRDRR